MMRSLFSGISGLKVHQTKMDVIGNNISNVNTVGFRASTVNFTDVFYQTTQNASGPNAETGAAGTNAIQIGLGANLASVSVDLSGTGATQRTDRGMDIMINGDAFLVVRSSGNTYFTKSGALDIDANGTLYCTTNGATVLGWGVDESGAIRKDTVSPLKLMGGEVSYSEPEATTDVTLSGNIDSMDEQLVSTNEDPGYPMAVSFYDEVGELYTAKLKIVDAGTTARTGDTPATHSYTVRVADVMNQEGKSVLKKLKDDGSGDYEATAIQLAFGGVELSPETTATTTPGTAKYSVDANGEITWGADTVWPTLTFNSETGEFYTVADSGATGGGTTATTDAQTKLNFKILRGNGIESFPTDGADINFSALTQYANNGVCSVKPVRGDTNGENAGHMAGTLNGFKIQTDGQIFGVYSNGDNRLLGQIAVATFANPSGLESVGNSMYAATLNSGDFDGIGVDVSEVGSFSVGALEMSDVDLATEFTNMITTQRGFQANSRIITTSDSMLEELVNLKR